MTPLTIAEQSFLKLDTPQQAKPAAAKAVSGAGFGNVMAQAQEDAPAKAQTAIATDTSDQQSGEGHTPAKAEAANSDAAPADAQTKAKVPAEAASSTAKAVTANVSEDVLPMMARLPEGGLTTKAAASDTAIARMTVKSTADGGKTVAAAAKIQETVSLEVAQPASRAQDAIEATSLNIEGLRPAVEGSAKAPAAPELVALGAGKETAALTEPQVDGEIALVQPQAKEKLQALNTTTSTAALTLQQAGEPTSAEGDAPVTTHASLSLRAQVGVKAAKPQAESQAASAAAEQIVAKANDGTEPAKSDSLEIASPEIAALQPEASLKDAVSEAAQPEVAQAEAVADPATDAALKVATVGAAVAAPVAARQSDSAQPAGRQSKAAPVMTADASKAPKAQAQGTPQQTTAQPIAPQAGKTAQADAPLTEDTPKSKGVESKVASAPSSFEQAMQQAVTKDAGPELSEVAAKPAELPQQAAAPQQPLAAVAPQVQVTNAPEAFQQLETAARDVATTELAMDQAEWPENMIESIGLETLADGEAMEIQLTPENMGRVQLRMELRDGAASISIVTETSEAAKQFNDNQQKLAELLAKQGVELANHNASTGRDHGRNDQGGQNGSAQANNNQSDATNGIEQTEAITARKDPNRLVDVQA
ncbi:flagellar hook-length control protein FliK [Donghicola eburneus]|uniref:Flagellar hook-length control protein-like C-terminal domain-containing protein n=1 Tax=Donghicola eburneus TaxID=393278 RepID=A0A1M4N2J5_9RHOB|nr:flagellar hook-length control protein FliK [Donghicola eburneus]SCM69110.1 hypothetical protein KARMA_3343 [Donghicola eburneus]SFQ35882.1 Flagellar hook-length control protein FliK [Donghicola eburneus]